MKLKHGTRKVLGISNIIPTYFKVNIILYLLILKYKNNIIPTYLKVKLIVYALI